MTDIQNDADAPSIRFKRRKLTYPKRAYGDVDAQVTASTLPHDETPAATTSPPASSAGSEREQSSTPNLKEILRNRKRPRDRFKDATRRPAMLTELVQPEGGQQHPYTGRFVAQTGQVVDRDDQQMSKYIEARLAEQNYRKYGWPIPTHLRATVEELAPNLISPSDTMPPAQDATATTQTPKEIEKTIRLAAGQGKIEEVDVAPMANRTSSKWQKLESGGYEEKATGKIRVGRDGKPRRPPKRRNSEDLKRDQMVEAVLRESKLDFFDAEAQANPTSIGTGNNDEDILERFRSEYYESIEEAKQQQRKPSQPVKGVKEAPKGPKLGGSKSARAKMRLQEEQAAKAKK